jgi:hypothetical protein
MRFIMSRFVSSEKERGFVNYEEMIKFLAKCLGDKTKAIQQPSLPPAQYAQASAFNSQARQPQQPDSSRVDMTEKYDPDEQAILRLMHENMRDWDQVNLIDCDNLRKKFYEIDPYNRYILTQREVSLIVF